MESRVDGGISKNNNLKKFEAQSSDVKPKDQIDLMARCWFSLSGNRTEPIVHEFSDARSGRVESVRVSAGAEHGIATIHDQDLLIFAISQWIEAKRHGMEVSRRISFTPYQFFNWIGRVPQGSAYKRLKDSLARLRGTTIETTIRSERTKRDRVRQFSWISEWEVTEENGFIRGIEVVLAEWLFESIKDYHVLTLDKRYFEIAGSVERWLYLYARKATGGANGTWKETFKSLYQKSASQQEYKHYASALRKIASKNELPGIRLECTKSIRGKDMLLMERTEKRELPVKDEDQLVLIEKSPAEEAWENVLDGFEAKHGAATVKSWLRPLQIKSVDEATLVISAPTAFHGQWIATHYMLELRSGWKKVGYPISSVKFEVKGKPLAV